MKVNNPLPKIKFHQWLKKTWSEPILPNIKNSKPIGKPIIMGTGGDIDKNFYKMIYE